MDNNNPTVEQMLVNPEKVLDDAYNKGVEHSLIELKNVYMSTPSYLFSGKLYHEIFSKISKLNSNGETS